MVAVAVIAVCVEFCSPLIRGLKRFDHILPVLIDLHWLPYPQRVIYKVCMLMFECLKGLAPVYLVAFCTTGSAVSGWSALKSAVRGDFVVPGLHRTDWGLRAFAVAGPSCWNGLLLNWGICQLVLILLQNTQRREKYLFRVFSDGARTFEYV